jgi:hypothetical protein
MALIDVKLCFAGEFLGFGRKLFYYFSFSLERKRIRQGRIKRVRCGAFRRRKISQDELAFGRVFIWRALIRSPYFVLCGFHEGAEFFTGCFQLPNVSFSEK